jgi:hypothetical protein
VLIVIRDDDPVFERWHLVEVGCVANVSEEHTASIISATPFGFGVGFEAIKHINSKLDVLTLSQVHLVGKV